MRVEGGVGLGEPPWCVPRLPSFFVVHGARQRRTHFYLTTLWNFDSRAVSDTSILYPRAGHLDSCAPSTFVSDDYFPFPLGARLSLHLARPVCVCQAARGHLPVSLPLIFLRK